MRVLRYSFMQFFSVLAIAGMAAAPASATCGSANCFLMTGTQEGVVPTHQMTVDLSFRYIPLDRRLEGSHGVDEVLTPGIDFENETIEPDHHREISTQNTLVQLDLAYGATRRLTIVGSLPLVNDRRHEHWDDVGTPEEAFSNSDGTSGFGDVRVGVRGVLLLKSREMVVGGLALKAPTGPYKLRDGEGAIGEPTLMPGTGSWDVVASVNYEHQWTASWWQTIASGAWRFNRANPLDYEMADEGILSAGVSRRVGTSLTWSLQANARRTGHDRYLGQEVSSTGATYVNLTPGLRVTGGDLSFYAFVQVPAYQHVNEAQLAPRTGILVGISKTF
ncbi:MAG TPA: transporter [Patescibacteria group bacterium]|nr:transporter [Patescibacteria group bacterium]